MLPTGHLKYLLEALFRRQNRVCQIINGLESILNYYNGKNLKDINGYKHLFCWPMDFGK